MNDLFKFIKDLSGRVLIVSHQNADLDAVCSSVALKDALGRLNPDISIQIGVPNSLSRDSKQMVDESEVLVNPSLDVDLLIILDSSTLRHISPLDRRIKDAKKIAVIDHHVPHKETEDISDFYIVDESASSSAELVYELVEEAGIDISERASFAILVGMLADSNRFRFATPKTIKIAGRVLDRCPDYQKALDIIEFYEEDVSHKIACLKAAKRMEIYRVDDWVLVTSQVKAFESKAANRIVSIGGDCAFVGSSVNGKLKISARGSKNFLKKTGINLGRDVVPRVGEFVGGSGGGHREAAGVKSDSGDTSAALEECVRVIKEIIKNHR